MAEASAHRDRFAAPCVALAHLPGMAQHMAVAGVGLRVRLDTTEAPFDTEPAHVRDDPPLPEWLAEAVYQKVAHTLNR
jgi:hypothetical protein